LRSWRDRRRYLCDAWTARTPTTCRLRIALVAFAMAAAPKTPTAFLVLASAYNFAAGFCYAPIRRWFLEAIGHGAAATKYNSMASISNAPILA